MQDYIIMTDSCCDLTDEMARELEHRGGAAEPWSMGGQTYRNTAGWPGHRLSRSFTSGIRAGRDRHHLPPPAWGMFEDADAGRCWAQGTGYSVPVLLVGPVHHLSVRRHRRRRSAAPDFPDGQRPGRRQPVSASRGPGAAGVSVRPREEGRGPLPQRDCGDWAEATTSSTICHWFTVDDLNHPQTGRPASAPPPPWWAPCSPSSRCCMWMTRAA